ncbi:hypothetical protein [Mycoplasma yeatsii]|uniref:hypothetical protein n=1 Tax=Mycoplasma yeatsii TaxID=51365 RepID=UPI0005B23E13|nr:hypothetical protein [Mycoplasma yeatsii]AJM71935.1 membrane protein [Mycoplasma yeatsii GM274B]
MASKSKLLSIIAGLLVSSSSVAGVTVGVLHNKRKLDAKTVNLNNDIPENMRSLQILYTENQEQILGLINEQRKILQTEKSHIDIQIKDVEFKFNSSVPSVTISAKKSSRFLKGSVEIKFNKPNINSLIKQEKRNLGVFEVRTIEKVIEILAERNLLDNRDFNAEKIKQNFDIQINEQQKTIKVKAKSDSIFYVGEVEFRYDLPQFSTLSDLKTNVDQLTDNNSNTVLNRFFELNKTLFEKENVKISRDQLQVEVSQNTAKITLTGNKNYQGSITVDIKVKDQFSSINDLNVLVDQLVNNNSETVLNRFWDMHKAKLEQLNINKTDLKVEVQSSQNKAVISITHTNYQGSITVDIKVKDQFSSINNLNVLVDQLVNNNSETVLNRFWDMHKAKLEQLNINKSDLKVEVQSSQNKAVISITHSNYQGSITVDIKVKDQFSSINDLNVLVDQLTNNNSETVLNRFWDMHKAKLEQLNINKTDLKVEVQSSQNKAVISITHSNYQGSITVDIKVKDQFSSINNLNVLVDQLVNNNSETVLNRFWEIHKSKLEQLNINKSDLKVEVQSSQNKAVISITHSNYQGSITVDIKVKDQFSSINNLNVVVDQLVNNNSETVLNRFWEIHKSKLEQLNINKSDLKVEVQSSQNKAVISITHANYQGSITVDIKVKDQFSSINNLNVLVDQLVNNNSETVLNRFWEIHKSKLEQLNINKTDLKVEVQSSQNKAVISITHSNYQGSITVDIKVKDQFSSINNLNVVVDQLVNNNSETVLNRFWEIHKSKLEQLNINKSDLKVEVQSSQNKAVISITHANYQGSITVDIKVKDQFSSINNLNVVVDQLVNNNSETVLNRFWEIHKSKLEQLNINKSDLKVEVQSSQNKAVISITHANYQGSITVDIKVKDQFSSINNLNVVVDQLVNNNSETVLNRFWEIHKSKLEQLNINKSDLKVEVQSSQNKAVISITHGNYQGSITVDIKVKDQFSSINNLNVVVDQLVNNNSETVLNRFWEIHKSKLEQLNINKSDLKVEVQSSQNKAVISITHSNYQGSITVDIKVKDQFSSINNLNVVVDQLVNNNSETVLNRFWEIHKSKLEQLNINKSDLKVEVQSSQNKAVISITHANYQGSITVDIKVKDQFSSINNLNVVVDQLVNNNSETVLNRFWEIHKSKLEQLNINKSDLKVEVQSSQNKAVISITHSNYQGSITVDIKVKTDIATLGLDTNVRVFWDASVSQAFTRFLNINLEKLIPHGLNSRKYFTITSFSLEKRWFKIKVVDHDSFQGELEIIY